ncbi:MAG: thioredoxin domain-containing protein [Actinomycetota bacterium]|nr:thioredoxin domain-containing protein [Actinomycetota bacterium]
MKGIITKGSFFVALFMAFMALLPCGCGEEKVTVISFYSKESKSAKEFEPVLKKAKKEYGDKVIFKHFDFKDPKNKKTLEKYYVSMDPSYVILNTKGEIKQTFMGKPPEDRFMAAISGLIPSEKGKSETSVETTPQVPSQEPSSSTQTLPPAEEQSP